MLCRYLLGSREAAEDATSEVFMKAQHAMESYNTSLPFRHWITRIARNHCLDVLRRRRCESRLFTARGEYEAADPGFGPLTQLLCKERHDAVRTAVERLPESYRVPLTLRYYEDLTYDEIAETLGLTRQGVATLLFRAKKKLRQSLDVGMMGGSHGMRL